jgi:hypothetical protein
MTLREKRSFTLQLGIDTYLRDQNVEISAQQIATLRNQLLIDLAHVDREHFDSKAEDLNDYIHDNWLNPGSAGDSGFAILKTILFGEQ